jgi:hypothetical protein
MPGRFLLEGPRTPRCLPRPPVRKPSLRRTPQPRTPQPRTPQPCRQQPGRRQSRERPATPRGRGVPMPGEKTVPGCPAPSSTEPARGQGACRGRRQDLTFEGQGVEASGASPHARGAARDAVCCEEEAEAANRRRGAESTAARPPVILWPHIPRMCCCSAPFPRRRPSRDCPRTRPSSVRQGASSPEGRPKPLDWSGSGLRTSLGLTRRTGAGRSWASPEASVEMPPARSVQPFEPRDTLRPPPAPAPLPSPPTTPLNRCSHAA